MCDTNQPRSAIIYRNCCAASKDKQRVLGGFAQIIIESEPRGLCPPCPCSRLRGLRARSGQIYLIGARERQRAVCLWMAPFRDRDSRRRRRRVEPSAISTQTSRALRLHSMFEARRCRVDDVASQCTEHSLTQSRCPFPTTRTLLSHFNEHNSFVREKQERKAETESFNLKCQASLGGLYPGARSDSHLVTCSVCSMALRTLWASCAMRSLGRHSCARLSITRVVSCGGRRVYFELAFCQINVRKKR